MTFCRSVSFGEIDEHLGAVDEAGRVCEEFVEICVIPGDVRILHRGGEVVPWNRAALAPRRYPARDGPILFSPGVVARHTAQCDAKSFSPAVGSPAASAVEP